MGMFSTMGVLSTMGDIVMHVGDMMSIMGVFSTVVDTILCNLSTVVDTILCDLSIVGEYYNRCGVPWRYSDKKRFPLTVLNTPTVLMISSKVLSIPMVLKKSLHGTQETPHIYHGIPHSTEHLHGTEHPWY